MSTDIERAIIEARAIAEREKTLQTPGKAVPPGQVDLQGTADLALEALNFGLEANCEVVKALLSLDSSVLRMTTEMVHELREMRDTLALSYGEVVRTNTLLEALLTGQTRTNALMGRFFGEIGDTTEGVEEITDKDIFDLGGEG